MCLRWWRAWAECPQHPGITIRTVPDAPRKPLSYFLIADDRNLKSGLVFQQNTPKSADAAKSATLDFSKPDLTDPAILNAILWDDAVQNGAVKGGED